MPDGCARRQCNPDDAVSAYGSDKSVHYYLGILSLTVYRGVNYIFLPELEALFFTKVR